MLSIRDDSLAIIPLATSTSTGSREDTTTELVFFTSLLSLGFFCRVCHQQGKSLLCGVCVHLDMSLLNSMIHPYPLVSPLELGEHRLPIRFTEVDFTTPIEMSGRTAFYPSPQPLGNIGLSMD